MTAARTTVQMVNELKPGSRPLLVRSFSARADYEQTQASADGEQCSCEEEGHWVRWRANPHQPVPAPADVIDEQVEGCFCCFWGPHGQYDRLVAESCDDRDIKVEHLTDTGRWVDFDLREVA